MFCSIQRKFYAKKMVDIISQILQFRASMIIMSRHNEKSPNTITINASCSQLLFSICLKGGRKTKVGKVRRKIGKRRVICTDKKIREGFF